ncbi:MAG: sigma 54-interacting transcriptional regulator [Myxococcales bacterium]|nr:sigma 54-interacting transcriptional regulator [Myxococcales bacterium]MCB9582676.1 sigma 54-interacting transcriptional regulator [Polyangiaceae bacterium]
MLLRFDDFELDEACFELRKAGSAITVQPKVLDLILYLARHRDRVVTKDELLERLWEGVVVTEASLSQAISMARRALSDSASEQSVIRTVRGKGFRFVAETSELGTGGRESKPKPLPKVEAPRSEPVTSPRRPLQYLGSGTESVAETRDDDVPRDGAARPHHVLYVVLSCEDLGNGGARHDLEGVDEVLVARGSERRSQRGGEITKTLTLTLPGQSLSRRHARFVSTRDGWYVMDEGSKNGTWIGGQRIEKKRLSDGDVVELGRTFVTFREHTLVTPLAADLEAPHRIFSSLSPELDVLSRDLERLQDADLPVLFLGETGVGKEHAARRLHSDGPFVVLDSGTVVAGKSVEQLFGANGEQSIFERAAGGTLLVDNVESLPADAQAALVRALETSPITVAGDPARTADVRVMATSSAALDELARDGDFRADLLARLSGFRCELPPLRARKVDLGLLIADLLPDDAVPEMEVAAARALFAYDWPGNVRELSQCLQVAAKLAGGEPIALEHLPPEVRGFTRQT